jgi:ribosomal protein S18 acetylase RimI-like enzyme
MQPLEIQPIDEHNLHFLKVLHHANLGHGYPDRHYTAVCAGLTRCGFLALSAGQAVGEITVQWQLMHGHLVLYISSLGVLTAFRRMGIATRLMDFVRDISWDTWYIYLHTHADN